MKNPFPLPHAPGFLRIAACCALFLLTLLPIASGTDPAFYKIPLPRLPLDETADLAGPPYRQSIPAPRFSNAMGLQTRFPYVWIEHGEAYVAPEEWPRSGSLQADDFFVAVAAPSAEKVRGFLFYPLAEPEDGFARLAFEIEPGKTGAADRESFRQIKAAHYERLTSGDFTGASWFRRQWRDARPENAPETAETGTRIRRETEFERTFALFSGGRAIAENLAIDDIPELTEPADERVQPISEIRGIQIQEYDWTEMLGEPPAKTDALARLIPADQHGLFFRDASALTVFMREGRRNGLPLFHLLDPAAVPAGLVERYEHQLGLPLAEFENAPTELALGAIAITGGDPFFATGTDVAILLETSAPETVFAWLEKKLLTISERETDAAISRSEKPRPTLVLANPNRTRSARVTVFENAVLLANSFAQTEAIHAAAAGERESLADLDEYLFFRNRYPADGDETAFLLLSDHTIRRWSGPEWRIGSSRRVRAAALLSDLTARHLPTLVAGEKPEDPPPEKAAESPLGNLVWTAAGPRSERYGHLGFLTPVSELKIETATAAEIRAYERWRNRYEGEWQGFFDPIAIRFSLTSGGIDADLTVMPLTASSEYRRLMELAGNSEIASGSGDPRENALLQAAIAVDPESEPMRNLAQMGQMFGADFGFNALAWMRGPVSLYFDQDLFWRAAESAADGAQFVTENFNRLPAALHIDSKSPTQLALFLGGIRTMIEQSAPGMLRWETRRHKDQPYVAISPAETSPADFGAFPEFTIFYAARSDALVVSLNEEVIRQSIDRFAARRDNAEFTNPPWPGKHLNLSLKDGGLRILESLFHDNYETRVLAVAHAPVPLLNDWKTRFPDRDPADLLRTFWRINPGEFVWNNEYKTHESPEFGSPANPRPQPALPDLLRELARLRLGISFEHDGIRARGILDRETADSSPESAPASDAYAIETARYAPHPDGATWTWRETSGPDVHEITETVIGRIATEDGERILIETRSEQTGEEPILSRSWYSDTDGLRLHRTESSDYTENLSSPRTILPARITPGQTYSFKTSGTETFDQDSRSVQSEIEILFAGFESVDVEAGSFDDCLKVVAKTVQTDDETVTYYTWTTWFAPDVGAVKIRWESAWDRGETELISYHIPD